MSILALPASVTFSTSDEICTFSNIAFLSVLSSIQSVFIWIFFTVAVTLCPSSPLPSSVSTEASKTTLTFSFLTYKLETVVLEI